ncbi:MAG: amidohydrolase [Acidobacteria bacterium]|nr:amidohydrolase [Acidobacteriota bacterium]
MRDITRRAFLGTAAAAMAPAQPPIPIIDIHQHTNYSFRTDAEMLHHQDVMGIAHTVLLPAGRMYGLEAQAFGNDSCLNVVKQFPEKYSYFANEVPYLPNAREVLERYLKQGAIGIGEQKFFVDASGSSPMDLICEVARDYRVPILLHFQYERYNVNYDQFWKVLKKYPTVNFIGHAQTFWANIDGGHIQEVLYPRWKVNLGGWTDRFLADYPNMFADLSAGSGLNAMRRDEDHARGFIVRHQDKLIYGSDCNDKIGMTEKCSGSQQIATIRKLAAPDIQRKIFQDNARKIMKLPA